ncbi:hypothetical protein PRK78_004632 [Emydomyces testavorans]|uniref:Aminoglycoside phosphotransferase domain-containing protein n=1 Tax=Emydomyces testavorans TaxID=2070801 RepID=A0AAF0DIW5_9EURO|nr:hypothetical protein PRK78_004632 [Emydomyces testavorans]
MQVSSSDGVPFKLCGMMSGPSDGKLGYYQILTEDGTTKYLAVVCRNPTSPDFRGEKLGFSTVPAGDWNVGRLSEATDTGKLFLDSVERQTLASVEMAWHPKHLEYASLGEASFGGEELQCHGQLNSTIHQTSPLHPNGVIANLDWSPEDIYGISRETEIYSRVEGHNIGPRFLAHITENQERVIGYVVERVPGRHATVDDLEPCRQVLSKLHALGIVHGSLSPGSFIMADDGRVVLHGFGGSYLADDEAAFTKEMSALEDVLRYGSVRRFYKFDQHLMDEIAAINKRDDGVHRVVFRQAERKGRIDITAEEHRRLLLESRANKGFWRPVPDWD